MSDREAWDLLRSGSQDVFARIYMEHYEALLNYGIKLCREQEIAEDAIQDLFVEIWKYRKNLQDTSSVRFYLLKGLRNKISAGFSKSRLHRHVGLSELSFFAEFSFETSLIQMESEKENYERLATAINSLSDRQKEVLYLRFYNNMDYRQISALMGISYQSTRNQLHLALKALKEKLPIDWHGNLGLLLLLIR